MQEENFLPYGHGGAFTKMLLTITKEDVQGTHLAIPANMNAETYSLSILSSITLIACMRIVDGSSSQHCG
jgi:hypothetical protein